jgi:CubicO group peptidase (beta-lactamase class C family)
MGIVVCFSLPLLGCGSNGAEAPLSSPLALEAPLERITQDLSSFIPQQLKNEGVPGLSVAVVRDGQLVWADGFGVVNTLSRKPVTAGSLFEVASHSKMVTAYAALRLVSAGRLELDAPLDRYLRVPLLPVSPQSAAITLRRVLTHTSGLSNLLAGVYTDKRIWFPPGDHFSYSGHGFEYLGLVMEDLTGEAFEPYVTRTVFADLGMTSSVYASDESTAATHANPHLAVANLLAVFGIAFGVLFPFTAGGAWLTRRLLAARQRRSRRTLRAMLTVNTLLSLAAFLVIFRLAGFPLSLVALSSVGSVLLLLFAVVACGARLVRGSKAGAAAFLALLASLGLLALIVTRPAVPLPLRSFHMPAAGGLRATAADLARLMMELMQPQHIDSVLVAQMLQPQVRVSERVSWGLGIGIQHGPQGDSFWHWGLNPGYESLMVGYPEQKIGVVVLTNGGPGGAGLNVARRVAHRAIGGDHYSYWNEVPGAFWPAGAKDRAGS